MTLGWLNTLDMNYTPARMDEQGNLLYFNKGIFKEFFDRIEGTSFDIRTAENVFMDMIESEQTITLLMNAQQIEPMVKNGTVIGIRLTKADGTQAEYTAGAVIDATQNGDIAAMAGVPYTVGREDLGEADKRMAVTLVFKMGYVTDEIWKRMADHPDTRADQHSIWGYWEMWDYPSSNPERVRMRGLNIGRQNDGTILINALQIFGIDPLDPESVQEAFDIGKREIPLVVQYMKEHFPAFSNLELIDVAPELYVRESRHIVGEYRLSIVDLLDNRIFDDRIAFGSYNVDIQSTSIHDKGSVQLKPIQYSIPFRSLVPKSVDGLLVVGRAASFDSLPHGSARVIPIGMATGQAAGVAAKIARRHGVSFRELAYDEKLIQELQNTLVSQGVDLDPVEFQMPDYASHPAYRGLKAAVSMYMAVGGETNSFALDSPSNVQRFNNHMRQLTKVHPDVFNGNPEHILWKFAEPLKTPVSLEIAERFLQSIIPVEDGISPPALTDLVRAETLEMIRDESALTNGEAYLIIADVVESLAGVVYD